MSNVVRVHAPGKINLSLDIVGIRNDGYHEIRTVMQAVDMLECVEVSYSNTMQTNIKMYNTLEQIPYKRNIAYKAVCEFYKKIDKAPENLNIKIKKVVPIGAGMGGGSADAGAVLVGLNKLTGVNMHKKELLEVACKVGADVAFCIQGGTALATGIGEKLQSITPLPDCYILICKPDISISTSRAYEIVDKYSIETPKSPRIEEMLKTANLKDIAKNLSNAFDEYCLPEKSRQIKQIMKKFDCLGCQMTGSGSAVFGIFDDYDKIAKCKNALINQHSQTYICKPFREGTKII